MRPGLRVGSRAQEATSTSGDLDASTAVAFCGGGRRAVPCRSRGVSGFMGWAGGVRAGGTFQSPTEGSSMERSLTNLLNRGVDPHLKGTVKRSGPRAIPGDAENTI